MKWTLSLTKHVNSIFLSCPAARIVGSLVLVGSTYLGQAAGVTVVSDYLVIENPLGGYGGFGQTLDANGSRIAVGARYSSAVPRRAFLFNENSLQSPPDLLISPSSFYAALFAYDISLSDNFALIGSLQESKAFLFDINTGSYLRSFNGSGTAFSVGEAVSVDGNRVAIGETPISLSGHGAVLLYDASTGQLIRRLLATDYPGEPRHPDYEFGRGVELIGNNLIVGGGPPQCEWCPTSAGRAERSSL